MVLSASRFHRRDRFGNAQIHILVCPAAEMIGAEFQMPKGTEGPGGIPIH